MRNLLFSLFAIAVASVAAMTATTALLNAPQPASVPVVETAALADAQTPRREASRSTTEGAAGHARRHARHRQARRPFCRRHDGPGGRR